MPEDAKKKTGTGGRTARKKTGTAGPVLKELLEILPELDDEGLSFLLEQAHVHRYNMEVERLNKAADRADARAQPETPHGSEPMRLERSKDGLTYHIVAGGKWKMFSAEEIAALVRITRSGEERSAVARRLYAWLDRERSDALDDLGIGKPPSPALAELLRTLLASFPARP